MQFKAVMFDYDGTVTDDGHFAPPQDLVDEIARVAQDFPISFCTGRNVDSFVRRGIKSFVEMVPEELKEGLYKNLFLVAENGCVGYTFDPEKMAFDEFYEVEWPEKFVGRERMAAELSEAVRDYGELFENAHKCAVVFRTNLYGSETELIKKVNELSDNIYRVVIEYLSNISPNYSEYFHVGNSGIGVLIIPADGDKDTGIKKFVQHLSENRNMTFEKDYRDVLVIGDRPDKGGNDEHFLNGKYGTPYTVGKIGPGPDFPLTVTDPEGTRLLHTRGTKHLLQKYFR